MRRVNIAIYAGLLAVLLIVAVTGGALEESKRQLLDLWVIAGVLIAVLLWGRLRFPRSTEGARRRIEPTEAIGQEGGGVRGSSPVSRVVRILVIAAAILCIAWVSLIYLGGMEDDAESIALTNIQLVTSLVTAGAALLLSRYATTIESSKTWLLRLAAVLMLLLEAVGLIVVPLIAMRIWTGYTDFEAYSRALNLNWFFLTAAAVAFCLFLSRRNRARDREPEDSDTHQ